MSFSPSASLLTLSLIPPTCQVASDLRTFAYALPFTCVPFPSSPHSSFLPGLSHFPREDTPASLVLSPSASLYCSVIFLMAPSIISFLCCMFFTLQPLRPVRAGLALPGSLLCPQYPARSSPPPPNSHAFLGDVGPSPCTPCPAGTTASRHLGTTPTACRQQMCSTTVCPCTTQQVPRGGSGGEGGGEPGTPHRVHSLQGTSWAWVSVSSMG